MDDKDKNSLVQQLQQQLTVDCKCREEKMIRTSNATKIPRIQKINQSVCMMKLPGDCFGTGFLADIPGKGVAFLSAGHNFSVVGEKKLPDDLDFSQFILHFGNLDGDLEGRHALKTCSLKDLGRVRGSIGYGGTKRFFPAITAIAAKSLPHEDYCFLILKDPEIKKRLNEWGLAYLEVGHGDFLDYDPNGLVQITGHPMNDDITREEGGKYPLRQSIGMEMVNNDEDSTTLLKYDADTLPGNSGSPVIGWLDYLD